MKKILIALLLALLCLSLLISCNKNESAGENETADPTVIGENTHAVEQDGEETKEGGETSSVLDIISSVTDETTSVPETTVNPSVDEPEEIINTWIKNSFTEMVPEPTFGEIIMFTKNDEEGISVNFKNVEADNVRKYIEQIKAAGFTENVEEQDTELAGFEVVQYDADKGNIHFGIAYTFNLATLIVHNK